MKLIEDPKIQNFVRCEERLYLKENIEEGNYYLRVIGFSFVVDIPGKLNYIVPIVSTDGLDPVWGPYMLYEFNGVDMIPLNIDLNEIGKVPSMGDISKENQQEETYSRNN